MAEVLGTIASALTIAALFKSCINAFDLVQAAKCQEADYNRLLVKFNIEKCRLLTWGQMMRLTGPSQHDAPRPLDNFQFRHLVIETLQMLHRLFSDSNRIQMRYGCQEVSTSEPDNGAEIDVLGPLTYPFLHFGKGLYKKKELGLSQKGRWVIRDRKKFADLITQIKEMVDGLQEITKTIAPIRVQESVMTDRITTIIDVDTLHLVSEACETDHPKLSQIASLLSEALSMSDTKRRETEAWLADASPLPDPTVACLEDMTLPELKRLTLDLMEERKEVVETYQSVLRLSSLLWSRNTMLRRGHTGGRRPQTILVSLFCLVYLIIVTGYSLKFGENRCQGPKWQGATQPQVG
ncbi:prion-inhibition and propagation-domain-containing protein [Tricladium varicosporioides]|nr:prion-inhibition and propagation-domain-containing protein [Hymenoscyphus varicosporioides]